jgi:hypothetical protein
MRERLKKPSEEETCNNRVVVETPNCLSHLLKWWW